MKHCKATKFTPLKFTDFDIRASIINAREKKVIKIELPQTETILSLAQNVWINYAEAEETNTQEKDPATPKFSWVGSQIQRIPFKALWETVVGPTFWDARRMGFLGSYEKWSELVREEGAKMKQENSEDEITMERETGDVDCLPHA